MNVEKKQRKKRDNACCNINAKDPHWQQKYFIFNVTLFHFLILTPPKNVAFSNFKINFKFQRIQCDNVVVDRGPFRFFFFLTIWKTLAPESTKQLSGRHKHTHFISYPTYCPCALPTFLYFPNHSSYIHNHFFSLTSISLPSTLLFIISPYTTCLPDIWIWFTFTSPMLPPPSLLALMRPLSIIFCHSPVHVLILIFLHDLQLRVALDHVCSHVNTSNPT